jgi:cytoskeletal protein CcmA (bactofilin family)
MRRWLIAVVVVGIWWSIGLAPSGAREIRQGDQCIIGARETIDGNLFALCRTLTIQGVVTGDVIGAATDADIAGKVEGDLYLAAGQLDINGEIGGSVHFIGSVLRIMQGANLSGSRSDLMSLSLSTTVEGSTRIAGNVTAAGYQLVLDGSSGGEVNFWGSALTINGMVDGTVEATVGDPQSTGVSQLQTLLVPFSWDVQLIAPGLVVGEGGAVEGSLRYTGPAEGAIAGRVAGETRFTQVTIQPDLAQIINAEEEGGLRLYLLQAAREFILLLVFGVIGLVFVTRPLQVPLRTIQTRVLPSLGVGLLAFIISFPIALIVALLMVLFIITLLLLQFDVLVVSLLSGMLLGSWAGALSVFYFAAIFISRMITALLLGRLIVRTTIGDDGSTRIAFAGLLVGTTLVALLISLPTVGLILNAIAAFLGLGGILIGILATIRGARDRLYSPTGQAFPSRSSRASAYPLPPPLPEDVPSRPGMDNLPPGFRWWDD